MQLRPDASVYARAARPGYTLVEVLIATTLALMLMAAVARMFGQLGTSVNNSRATLEMAEKLRTAAERLRMDLVGVTVTMLPPRRVENNDGYFEYIERGPYTPVSPPTNMASTVPEPVDTTSGTANATTDSSFVPRYLGAASTIPAYGTVGETGDILMFTTRNAARPFTGLCNNVTIQSDVAEVAWFMRGRTLYRRVLLVAPSVTFTYPPTTMVGGNAAALGFYYCNDISAHVVNDVTVSGSASRTVVPNTLGDLSRRGCRFAHDTDDFPFLSDWGLLGLPTLQECSNSNWPTYYTLSCQSGDHDAIYQGGSPPANLLSGGTTATVPMDYWGQQPFAYSDTTTINPVTGIITNANGVNFANGSRITDDVILTNVIGFDVKAWDPVAGAYVDLGQQATWTSPQSPLQGPMNPMSQLFGPPFIYDTWTDYYENAGLPPGTLPQPPPPGQGHNGFDNGPYEKQNPNGSYTYSSLGGQPLNGMVNSSRDAITSPPYPVPLRGIQVKIRVFEPDSRNIREVTVTQDFSPK